MINLKKWRIGEYLRELSVIVIGIAITFWGSGLINDINTRKSLKQELIAVESELMENEKEITEVLRFYSDLYKYRLLLSAGDIQKADKDSLRKYQYTITNIVSYNYKKDAFDMLKYSGGLKEIKDKNKIMSIMECYMLMEQAKEVHDSYMNSKINLILNNYMNTDNLRDVDLTLGDKKYMYLYNFILGYNGMEESLIRSKNQINKLLNEGIVE